MNSKDYMSDSREQNFSSVALIFGFEDVADRHSAEEHCGVCIRYKITTEINSKF